MDELRRQLYKRWGIFAFLILTLILAQEAFGQYRGMSKVIWGWVFITLKPVFFIYLYSGHKYVYPDKAIPASTSNGLKAFQLIYLVLILLTILLSQAAVSINGWSTRQYFLNTLWLMIPLNVILSFNTYLALVFNEPAKMPGSSAIVQLAEKALSLAESTGQQLRSQCLRAVSKGQLEEAFNLLGPYFQDRDTELFNHIVLLQSRYAKMMEDERLGTVEAETVQVQRNKLSLALLNISNRLKETG